MVKELKSKNRADFAKHFLAELLDETLNRTCTDTQHEFAYEFKMLLGNYCPDWIDPDRQNDYEWTQE